MVKIGHIESKSFNGSQQVILPLYGCTSCFEVIHDIALMPIEQVNKLTEI